MINAIETRYAGCHFRSRLEARWAVFFDTLGIEWQYEPEAFTVGCEQPCNYLPDFFLPTTQTWVEVKGSVTEFDWQKLANAVDFGALPYTRDSYGVDDRGRLTRGLLLLGPVPRPTPGYTPTFPIIQHGGSGCRLTPVIILEEPCALWKLQRVYPHIELEYDEFFDSYGCNDDSDEWVQAVKMTWPESAGWVKAANEPRADAALTAARSHRFGT